MSWNSSTKMCVNRAESRAGRRHRLEPDRAPEQEIEKIQLARARLERFVPLDRAAKLLLQRGGEVRVSIETKLRERRAERIELCDQLSPRHA